MRKVRFTCQSVSNISVSFFLFLLHAFLDIADHLGIEFMGKFSFLFLSLAKIHLGALSQSTWKLMGRIS